MKINEKIKFYVAECMEFPSLGKYVEGINTLDEAIKIYNKIPNKRLNGIKGIGFELYKDGEYDSSFDLIVYGKVDVELINFKIRWLKYLLEKFLKGIFIFRSKCLCRFISGFFEATYEDAASVRKDAEEKMFGEFLKWYYEKYNKE